MHNIHTGLGDAVSEHAPQFLAHCICGEDLLKLNRQKLEYLQVGFIFTSGECLCCVVLMHTNKHHRIATYWYGSF